MYIPAPHHHLAGSAARARPGGPAEVDRGFRWFPVDSDLASVFCRLVSSPFRAIAGIGHDTEEAVLQKRQFSSNEGRNTNIKIGIILAFLIPAFLALLVGFLFYYRGSIHCVKKKKKRHHRHKSVSSRSSSHRGLPPRHPPPPRHPHPPHPPPPPPPPPDDDGPPPPPPPPPPPA